MSSQSMAEDICLIFNQKTLDFAHVAMQYAEIKPILQSNVIINNWLKIRG